MSIEGGFNREGEMAARQRQQRRNLAMRRRRATFRTLLVVAIIASLAVAYTYTRGGFTSTTTSKPTIPPASTTSTFPPSVNATAQWRLAWGSPMAWGYGTAFNTTVREIATVAIAGQAVRVRVSNLFGTQPLDVGAATVARQQVAASVLPGSVEPLKFNGSPSVIVPVGKVTYSDPVTMAVASGESLAVSLYVSNADLVTLHPCCSGETVSYFTANGTGNQTSALTAVSFPYSSKWPRWVDAVDVLQGAGQGSVNGSIVVVGDSITEGFNTTLRWTDVLQSRIDLLPAVEQRAVINEGITANTLTDSDRNDSKVGGGPPGLERLNQDALGQAGVSTVILLLGTNDLYFGATAAQVIAGLRAAIVAVHRAHMKIIGVTLLPRAPGKELWNSVQQSYLQQVDTWILQSKQFDGVLNLATVVADDYNGSCKPTSLFPAYNSGDNLHPSAAGQIAMANAVTGSILSMPPLPLASPAIPVTPTPHCLGVPGIPSPAQVGALTNTNPRQVNG